MGEPLKNKIIAQPTDFTSIESICLVKDIKLAIDWLKEKRGFDIWECNTCKNITDLDSKIKICPMCDNDLESNATKRTVFKLIDIEEAFQDAL